MWVRPLGCLFSTARKFRVAAQEWIDENDGSGQFDAEGGMTEPDKLHVGLRKGLEEQGDMSDMPGARGLCCTDLPNFS